MTRKDIKKIYLVGAGYWGSKIKATLQELNVKAIVIDIRNGNTLDDITEPYPVIIATPALNHFEQAKTLIKRGYDILIEKPAACTAEEVAELMELQKEHKVVVYVGHLFTANPRMEIFRAEASKLGPLSFMKFERTNLGIYQTQISPLLSLAVHDFSIIDYMFDDITVEYCRGYKLESNSPQFDRVVVNGFSIEPGLFSRQLKVPWEIEVSWRDPKRRRIVTAYGEYGQTVWDEDAETVTTFHNEIVVNKYDKKELHFTRPDGKIYRGVDAKPLALQLEYFIAYVLEKDNPRLNGPATNLDRAYKVAQAVDTCHKNIIS